MKNTQTEYLHTVLSGGNQQVPGVLELLTGRSLGHYSIQITVLPATNVPALMDFSSGPLATVICGLQGDVEGDFLMLQEQRDIQILNDLMSPALTGNTRSTLNNATDYLIPDWLVEQRQQQSDTNALQSQMLDAISELGNMLFGAYLQALYSSCKLAVFQDTPEASLKDTRHTMLKTAIARNSRDCNMAFAIGIEYAMQQEKLQAWLLMLPLSVGLEAMLDCMDAR